MKLRVALDELLPTKAAARELPQALDRLDAGDVEQLVITRRNEPRAVLLSIERYEELLQSELLHQNGNGNGQPSPTTVTPSPALVVERHESE